MSKTEKVRKGPSESATKFSIGFVKKGNDGNMWKIVATTAGVHRWTKISKTSAPKNSKNSSKDSDDNSHSAKTPFEMTEYAARVFNSLKKDKKIKITKVVKGKAALAAIKKVFFGDDKVEADKWQKETKWSSRDIANSIFIIYKQKLIKNTIKKCKFVIAHKEGGSVLGQRI